MLKRLRDCLSKGASGILATTIGQPYSGYGKACIMERGSISPIRPSKDVVCEYIEPPHSHQNYAVIELADDFIAFGTSEEDLELLFPINVFVDSDIFFGLSIETFIPGEGWEHILHQDPVCVANQKGCQTVRVKIPHLPLIAGKYVLNLFLNCTNPYNAQEILSCDMRSWLTGNEVKFLVSGNESQKGYALPLSWECS